MDYSGLLQKVRESAIILNNSNDNGHDEVYLEASINDFKALCVFLHHYVSSPVMTLFCSAKNGGYALTCGFEDIPNKRWIFAVTFAATDKPEYDTLSKDMHSAALFEREIYEMFGVKAKGSPDMRRLHLHDEVWPKGNFPLRKDFDVSKLIKGAKKDYVFHTIEGEGIFEVPVGPVHAGIIGPGHFRFSCAGEPIINLEIRLGFTHRGVEKQFENKYPQDCIGLSERVSGDSSFAHGLSFCHAAEKIYSLEVPESAARVRCLYLELERMYNHVADMGGIALDVGFSFAAAYASVIKEKIHVFNESMSGSRYLKGINVIGGVTKGLATEEISAAATFLDAISKEYKSLKDILLTSDSFMDRVDGTGKLGLTIAQDLGIAGLCARASGISSDLRKDFPRLYDESCFIQNTQTSGDVLSRLKVRMNEFEESINIIENMITFPLNGVLKADISDMMKQGKALGYKEGWRGPVLYWIETDATGKISRCKITDPSFHNWQGLSYAVRNNIIPDFPVCNKSFNLSYSGNDL